MGKCAFLNSYKILGKACKETPIDVVNYLVDAMQLHHGKSFLIAPYLQRSFEMYEKNTSIPIVWKLMRLSVLLFYSGYVPMDPQESPILS
uniref:Uncharacterized protein n=1 Tax=Lactuca sativa TaxID=4236 RepID=A0A9R1VGQ7_LACSA|nr:hypothetical protein LSAT_V11C500262160 [Lactuca sativa]